MIIYLVTEEQCMICGNRAVAAFSTFELAGEYKKLMGTYGYEIEEFVVNGLTNSLDSNAHPPDRGSLADGKS